MKKLTLLLLSGAVTFGAHAQKRSFNSTAYGVSSEARTTVSPVELLKHSTAPNAAPQTANKGNGTANKGTATPFVTEDFSSGTVSTLPTGWVRGTGGGSGGWRWTRQAATSQFSGSLGVINSTTASNGWLIFDSDSIGSVASTPSPIFEGTITSPAYNCATHPTVLLQFQSYYKKLQDSCWVQVSRDNFASFTEFPVNENNTLTPNGFSANPADVRINISSVAGGQASVKLRFRYKNEYLGGTYAWMIDDLALSELDPVEVQARLGGVIAEGPSPSYTGYSTYSSIPLSLVTPVTPILALTNNGSAGQTNVPVSATIFRGTTQVYNQVATYPSLPAVAVDSLVEWTGAGAAYTPSTIDNYVATFGVNLTGDGYTRNNVDTFRFNVTDSSYTTYASTVIGGYFLHRPNTHASGEANFYFGTRFDIPTGKSDTLTSISASFGTGTAVGSRVIAHVYKLNDANPTNMTWDNVASSRELTLTANDISITGTTRFATFPMNIGLGIGSLILGEGTYVTAVTTNAVPAANTVTINATAAKYNAPGIVGYYGHTSDANNNGAADFAIADGIATGLRDLVPVIRMNFGRYAPTSVGNIPGVTVSSAFPNPANNAVSMQVTVKESASVTVTLSNMVGQVMDTQNLGLVSANGSKNATFSTAGIANGVYFLTVEANGGRSTTRFVVAH